MKNSQTKHEETLFTGANSTDKISTKDKPKICVEYCRRESENLLNQIQGITNAFANKNGYFTTGFKGDELYWYQLMGNLSSTASHLAIDDDCKYIVFSEKILNSVNPKDILEMAAIEKIIHKKWQQFKNAWILTETDLWSYLATRYARFPDEATLNLMEGIKNA